MLKELWNKDMLGVLTFSIILFGTGFVIGNNISATEEWNKMRYMSEMEQSITDECIRQYNEYALEMQKP